MDGTHDVDDLARIAVARIVQRRGKPMKLGEMNERQPENDLMMARHRQPHHGRQSTAGLHHRLNSNQEN